MREGTAIAAQDTDAGASEFRVDEPLSSLLSTTMEVLLSPRRFFDELPPDGPLEAPVLYFLICSAITAVSNLLASLTFLAVPVGIALATGSTDTDLLITILAVFVFASLVALPVLLVAAFFVSVLIQHAFIRLVAGRDQEGLRATARVSCYAVGAPVAVAWIPLAGFLAIFYCFYLNTTGLRRVHRISTGRSLGAVLILVALSLVLATGVTLYEYSVIREAMEKPVSRYLDWGARNRTGLTRVAQSIGSAPAQNPPATPTNPAAITGPGSSFVLGDRYPEGIDGLGAPGVMHAEGEQIPSGGLIALGVAPQRVPASAVYLEHEGTHPLHRHGRLDMIKIFEDLRAPVRRGTKLGSYPLPGHAPQAPPTAPDPGIDVTVESSTGVYSFRQPGYLPSFARRPMALRPRLAAGLPFRGQLHSIVSNREVREGLFSAYPLAALHLKDFGGR